MKSEKKEKKKLKFQYELEFLYIVKYTIAFDLDETLIHCNESPENSDIVLPIKFPSGQTIEVFKMIF